MICNIPFKYLTPFVLIAVLLGIAHSHPGTSFTIPFVPSFATGPPGTYPFLAEPENLGLSEAQCTARYPDLFREADRAQQWYAAKGGISLEMVGAAEEAGGNARLVILNNKLYVKHFNGGVNSRTRAAIAAVYRTVVTSAEPLPNVDFVIQTGDAGGGEDPVFALDRRQEQEALWLMPDFGFFSWPEPGVGAYTEVRDKALAYEEKLGLRIEEGSVVASSWDRKTPELFWRGVPMVEIRHDMMRGCEGEAWCNVRELDWGAVNQDEEDRLKNGGDLKTMAEHCQYAFLAHTEGWAYSGRLKYLQQCRSVIVTHPLEYIQHYHHLFNVQDGDPEQNMVQVALPLERNLPAAMERLLAPENREMVERIASNSWWFLREGYISSAANECYFRYALRAYASTQTFDPSLEGRAVPYESFLLMGTTHWDPHRR